MTTGNPPSTQKPVRGCQTFANRELPVHLALYTGGISLWITIYVTMIIGIGSPELAAAETSDGIFLRQLSVGVASAVTGLYFAAAYTQALGAPLPNLVAASAISALMPARVLTLGNAPPSPVLITSDLLSSALVLSGGSAITILVVISWYYIQFGGTGTDSAEQWESEHFPPGFRLAISATDSGEIDWDQSEYGISEWSYWRFFLNGAIVLTGGLILYGVVLAGQATIGELLILQMLEETPWLLLALTAIAYVWWTNYKWRTRHSQTKKSRH